MARVLAISSQVARGAVGLSAIVPALQALGHEVIALPTVLLSNHPGHAHVAGEEIAPTRLAGMLGALAGNGWLSGLDAVLTGYLPSAAHVAFAADAVTQVRAASPAAIHVCDPVLGDEPKGLYIEREAAVALRDVLVPVADIVKLNRFEAGWLAGDGQTHLLGRVACFVTSAAGARPGEIANRAHLAGGLSSCGVARRAVVPKGTGDLFSGLLLGYRLAGDDWKVALGRTVAAVEETLALGGTSDALAIVAAMPHYRGIAPFPVEPVS